MNKLNWAFFGTSKFSVVVLDELKSEGLITSLIVTTEDKPKGRKLILTAPETKTWAIENNIPYIQPKTLKDTEVVSKLSTLNFELFIVASYGKIIPQNILDIPKYKTLNVHPSLLPRLRGASPIQSAILNEDETGVSIIRLDSEMDHGPILHKETVATDEWPTYAEKLEKRLGEVGGKMLVKILPDWIDGKILEKEQDHSLATFCKKIEKTDGELNLEDSPEINLRKIMAYCVWPGAYYFEDRKRMIVKQAHIEDSKLVLDRIVPEGKKEMSYKDYLNGKKVSK